MFLDYTVLSSNPTSSSKLHKALSILERYGDNALLFMPGIGTINGVLAKNWLDTLATLPAQVNLPVARVDTALNSSGTLQQSVSSIQPTLKQDGSNYYWEFNGTNSYLSLNAPLFQLSDSFCIVAGVSLNTITSENSIFAQSNNSNHSLPEFMFNASGKLGVYVYGGGTVGNSFGGASNSGTGTIVATLLSDTSTLRVRRNTVEVTTLGLSGTYGTATRAALAANPTLSTYEYLSGKVYPLILIKGTVPSEDVLILEDFIAICSNIPL